MISLKELQNSLTIKYGSFNEEAVEQEMTHNFLRQMIKF